jgi:hypothetical protein
VNPRLIEVPNPDGMPTPLRRFADQTIQSQIDGVLDRMAGTVAAVAHVDGSGYSLSVVVKVGNQISVMAGAYQPWGGRLGAEAEIVFQL